MVCGPTLEEGYCGSNWGLIVSRCRSIVINRQILALFSARSARVGHPLAAKVSPSPNDGQSEKRLVAIGEYLFKVSLHRRAFAPLSMVQDFHSRKYDRHAVIATRMSWERSTVSNAGEVGVGS